MGLKMMPKMFFLGAESAMLSGPINCPLIEVGLFIYLFIFVVVVDLKYQTAQKGFGFMLGWLGLN